MSDVLSLARVASPGTSRTRIKDGVSDVVVMTKRYVLQMVRVPSGVVFTLIQPAMFVVLFRYVFGGAIHAPGTSYAEYMIPGAIAQSAAFSSFGTAIGLSFDLGRGLIDRIRAMPTARYAVLLGRLGADTVRTLATVIVLLGIGYAVGFRFDNGVGPALLLVMVSVLFGTTICCVAAAIGLVLKDPEAVQSFGLIWLFPLTFISGAFVPVQSMPGWLQGFARANPVTLLVEAMRSMSYGGPIALHLLEGLAWIVGILAVFGPLAVRTYKRAS